MAQPLFAVVSGPPASGNWSRTLAPEVARSLVLPLLAKDTIRDPPMSALGVPDVETSRQLGRAAVRAMLAVAAHAPAGAVLESNFSRSAAADELRRLPGRIIEAPVDIGGVPRRIDRVLRRGRSREDRDLRSVVTEGAVGIRNVRMSPRTPHRQDQGRSPA